MFENVTAQTRDDAQGNWHHPAHDMLRGSIARDRLRCIAVADFESGGMSPRQKELFASMPVTRRLLRLRDVAEYKAVEAADEDPSRSMKFFSTIGKPRRFGILPASEVALQQWMSNWTNQVKAVSSALLQMLCSCLASSRLQPPALLCELHLPRTSVQESERGSSTAGIPHIGLKNEDLAVSG